MRRGLVGLFVAYLLIATYLVLWPQPDTPSSAVAQVTLRLAAVGFTGISGTMVEFALNVVLFVPLTFLSLLIWPSIRPGRLLLVAVLGTCAIELVQYVVLPARSATVSDLVANTVGAVIGVAGALLLRWDEHWVSLRGRAVGWWRFPVAVGFVAVVGVAVLLLLTSWGDRPVEGVLSGAARLREAGVPVMLTSAAVWRVLAGAVLFVPAGLLGGLLVPTWTALRWLGVGLLLGAVIELAGGEVGARTTAAVADVVASGAGMFVGALGVHAALAGVRSSPRPTE